MSKASCFLFAAGSYYGLSRRPGPEDTIIAADGGYRHCLAAGLTPHLLVGDFDSLDCPLPPHIPAITFPKEKDDTDTMLAIREGLRRGYRSFHLYGCTGGRPDHSLANLQALHFLAQEGARGFLYHEIGVFTVIKNGRLDFPPGLRGMFSLFAMGGAASGVAIRGGRYSLEGGTLLPTHPLGVSNEFFGAPVSIWVEDGALLVYWEGFSLPTG